MENKDKITIEKLLINLNLLHELLINQISEHSSAIAKGAPARDYKEFCYAINDAIKNTNETIRMLHDMK